MGILCHMYALLRTGEMLTDFFRGVSESQLWRSNYISFILCKDKVVLSNQCYGQKYRYFFLFILAVFLAVARPITTVKRVLTKHKQGVLCEIYIYVTTQSRGVETYQNESVLKGYQWLFNILDQNHLQLVLGGKILHTATDMQSSMASRWISRA